MTNGTGETTATRLERAIAAADVGADLLPANVVALAGLGPLGVEDGRATVPVTLPVPSARARDRLAQDLREAALDVEGVTDVAVRFEPSAADPGERVGLIPDVKNVVAVSSGKGGVGKSTLSVNLAVALAEAGAAVGLLDADVYGPNAPAMLGLADHKPDATGDDLMVPREAHGVRVMSMGFIVGEEDPVIWRGPVVDEFLKQLFDDVAWGDLDYLVVDMPPGTGDAQLSLVQHLPLTGAVVVTTPQAVAVDDARRGLEGFRRYGVPVLGVAENMAGFRCPDCGGDHDIFDAGGADDLARSFDVPVLGRIPIDPAVGTLGDDADPPDPPGVDVPVLGRVGLPRTQAERERPGALAPVVLREDGGATARALERFATQTAGAINLAATDAAQGE
jgi:ATP-binding protein involved in chromosome partitioning